jgi:hypothetical protein
MAGSIIRIKRSAVPGKKPTTSDLVPGELALNTFDAELYVKRVRAGIGTDIVRIGIGATVTNILYVTQDGSDTNTGKKLGDAKRTIKGAVAESTEGTVIKVSAGIYVEDNPIVLPDNVSVVGDSLREVSVIPQNQDDLFHVGKGCYVAEMSYLPLDGQPNPHAIFAFDPNNLRYIDQSPYIQNCTNFIPGSIGLQVDGSKALGPLKSMVLDSYTQYNPNGVGASMTNEGYAQLVSLFTICDNIAVYCGSGGACDLTNSNSSFGNFGLVADGVGPLKYKGSLTQNIENGGDTFVVDLTTPTLNIVDAEYDNQSGVLTAYTNQPHMFSVGMGITIAGLGFTCPSGPGIVTYPSGAYGYIFRVRSVGPGRYLDAYDSIVANKQEIQDKSIAAIALKHPDFYFPGDERTNERSRYYDSYRLIQQNRQEIVDKSLVSIAVGFPSDFYFPEESETNPRSRYYDSYRLIQENRQYIINTAWNLTSSSYPGIIATEEKCKRDIGFFVDAISTDIFIGGNKYSRDFTLQYFNNGVPISNGLLGEETQSIFAFNQAKLLMKEAITNRSPFKDLSITGDPIPGSNPPPYGTPGNTTNNTYEFSCFNVQTNIDNLVGIVTTVIGAGNTSILSTFNENLGISTTLKCARDLGYLVDAISTDVFTGGNKYSRDFTLQYFNNGVPISNGLVGETAQSVYAFRSVGTYAKKAITNQLNRKDVGISSGPAIYGGPGIGITVYPSGNPNSCTDVQSNIDTLVGIVTTVLGTSDVEFLDTFSENLGSFTVGGSKCYRDIGYIIDAVALDVRDYTNENIINATKSYFNASGTELLANGVSGETQESITAFHAVRDYAKLAINNQLNTKNFSLIPDPITNSNNNPNSCSDVKTTIDNLVGIITTFVGQENLSGVSTLPSVSMASTVFSINVGTSTLPHTYTSGGTVEINVVRPFDGEVVYFDDLYYTVTKVNVINGGSGYVSSPTIVIDSPTTEWGIPAQAVAEIRNGSIVNVEMISNGRGYTSAPPIRVETTDVGVTTAKLSLEITPTYYFITRASEISSGISTVTIADNLPYVVPSGTTVNFYKQSRVLASGHSLEYIGSGTNIQDAIPFNGGVAIQENETDAKNGGLVVFTSTDQSGNFRIGDGVIVNQASGTISGVFYSKSLFSTITPFILALGGD